MSEAGKPKGSIFELTGVPSLKQALPLAVQHVVAMIVGCVTPAIIVSGAANGGAGLDTADQVILIQSALVVAALAAEGVSQVSGLEHIRRGYEGLEAQLSALGGKIQLHTEET